MNLLERINEVRKAISYIQKDKSVSTGSSGSYKAVTHDAVTAMVRQPMIEHGIICWPNLIASIMNPPIIDKDMVPAKQRLYEATYDFTFANMEKPDDMIIIRIQAHAMDNADKAPGKALSYAKKYAILKLFEIETGESDESIYADNAMDESVVIDVVKSMRSALNVDDLKSAFLAAESLANNKKDQESLKSFIRVKNECYKNITRKDDPK